MCNCAAKTIQYPTYFKKNENTAYNFLHIGILSNCEQDTAIVNPIQIQKQRELIGRNNQGTVNKLASYSVT